MNTALNFHVQWLTSGSRNAIALAKEEPFTVSQGELADDVTKFYCSVLQGQSTRAVVSKFQFNLSNRIMVSPSMFGVSLRDKPTRRRSIVRGKGYTSSHFVVLCNDRWLSVT